MNKKLLFSSIFELKVRGKIHYYEEQKLNIYFEILISNLTL